jgi:hypothetical protein
MISKIKLVAAEKEWELALHSDSNTYSSHHSDMEDAVKNHTLGPITMGTSVKMKNYSLTGTSREVKKIWLFPLSTKTALLSMCHCIVWHISNCWQKGQASVTHTTYT